MTNSRSTKNALISSILVLALCFSMLLGTTFAWFTDTAASNDNKVVSGTLDVELWQHTSATEKKDISDSHDALFTDSILWEPNRTEVVYLSIRNNGSLALKYKVAIDVTNVSEVDLTEVMEYDIIEDAQYGSVTAWADEGTKVVPGLNATQANDVELAPEAVHYFALAVHMDKDAGNKYQGQSITFDIKVLAGQATEESDAFGDQYDAEAAYPTIGSGYVAKDPTASAQEVAAYAADGTTKVATATIPSVAADPAADGYKLIVEQLEEADANITVEAGSQATTYEIKVEGILASNTEPIKVILKYIPGLDPDTVKLYHYTDEIDATYKPETGYITFYTATFSPFTVVADVTSVYVAPEVVLPENLPVANVAQSSDYENVDLEWKNVGGFYPTEGLDSQLEAAYTFSCVDTLDEAKASEYANWHCDFYVMLDEDLGANEIFLGGNYGSFGWVGFHNGDLTLEANTEIPLLGSVTQNPWTYVDVVQNVGTFICGVGDVDDALSGATFTVMLRLTNPDDATEYYNVKTITHTFA